MSCYIIGLIAITWCLACVVQPASAQTEKRVALIVGNATVRHGKPPGWQNAQLRQLQVGVNRHVRSFRSASALPGNQDSALHRGAGM